MMKPVISVHNFEVCDIITTSTGSNFNPNCPFDLGCPTNDCSDDE